MVSLISPIRPLTVGYGEVRKDLPSRMLLNGHNQLIFDDGYVSVGVQSPGAGCASQPHYTGDQ